MAFPQQLFNGIDACEPTGRVGQCERTAIAVGRIGFESGKEERFEPGMKELDIADADGSDRVAMVGELQVEKAVLGAGLGTRLLPVLHGHFEGHFNRRWAVVGIEHPRESFRRNADQFARQSDRRRIRQAEQSGVRDPIQLFLDGPVQGGMPVAMQIHPDGWGPVEVLLARGINEIGASPALDDERFLLFPFLHLREGMPEVSMIPVDELSSRRLLCHGGGVAEALRAYCV